MPCLPEAKIDALAWGTVVRMKDMVVPWPDQDFQGHMPMCLACMDQHGHVAYRHDHVSAVLA